MENLLARAKVRWWLFIVGRRRKHGRYAEALEILQKVLAAQPNRADALLRAGFCLTKLNRYEEALESYERALQVVPNYADAHAYAGLAYHELGRNREALESLNRAFRMRPSLMDDPYWLHMFGLISGNAEQWEQSVTTFTKLTKSNGRNGNAWHGLGWSLARLNRDSEALGPLQRSIQLGPQNADAYRELGDSYFKLHRFNEAVEQFQQYIKLKPNDPAGHHSLGMAYCELGEFGSAVEPISRALALGPEFAQLERVEDAKDILTRAGTVNSGDSKLHHSFGELYLKLGMRDEAYREHEVLLLLDPSLADALAKLLDAPPNS